MRVGTVFPVELQFHSEKKTVGAAFLQAFTRNVSFGGMCLELTSFDPETEHLLSLPDPRLALIINTPFNKRPIQALAKIAWIRKEDTPLPARYLIGVAYTQIDPKARKRIFKHVRRLQWVPRLSAAFLILMLFSLAAVVYHDQTLIFQNRKLVKELVVAAEKKSMVASNLFQLQKKKGELEKDLKNSQEKIKALEESITSLRVETIENIETYETELAESLKKQGAIRVELEKLRQGRESLKSSYKSLEMTGVVTSGMAMNQMVSWLGTHQNLKTGLVASFEGDPFLEDWAFSYDQSLACQIFLIFGESKRAADILNFYERRAQRNGDVCSNAYDTVDGRVVESVAHSGPNIWIGIAALHYGQFLKDNQFLPLAKRIGDWVVRSLDDEGGLKGGPSVSWYSTEHNLDAYAFLKMLAKETQDVRYEKASDQILNWIKKYAYSLREKRMNRGKGDATIATDTFSWAVAAIGPETLQKIGFDAEAIMEFAEKNCEVGVRRISPGGKTTTVYGFDFAKAQNLGRGGVISTEWTGQMIVSYQILSDYFKSLGEKEKAGLYQDKADFYLTELQKLIITSPSRTGQGRGCLPYASIDNVDTGHGWRTPKGIQTGSVSGTAYGIFAWLGYNPFELETNKQWKLKAGEL